MEIMAPAKINLYLKVFGRREDGYHQIGTLFERISIFDRISIEISGNPTKIEVSGENIPTGEDSLLIRTVKLFKVESGSSAEFSINIEKNIPVAAGMGGGSSDVASLLRGMNRILGNPISEEKLGAMAGSLGADIPFFLKNVSFGLGTGRGDDVREVKTNLKLGHIIVNPPLRVETKAVYSKVSGFNLTKDEAWDTMLTLFLNKKAIVELAGYLCNDLQQIVLREFPLVGETISFLKDLGAKTALMTGSGPTVFGIFDEEVLEEKAEKAREHFKGKKGWRVYSARTV
jgi:4-diphosphocytidyl-2-C-methyl-D-erythritol kinase